MAQESKELFRRFRNGQISLAAMLKLAEKLTSAEYQTLIQKMLRDCYPVREKKKTGAGRGGIPGAGDCNLRKSGLRT